MGCGSSGSAVAVREEPANGATKATNGAGLNGHHHGDGDDLPTVVLPETPAKPKPRKIIIRVTAQYQFPVG